MRSFSATVVVGNADIRSGRHFNVVDVIVHPNFTEVFRESYVTPYFSLYNDIALLKLAQTLPLDGVTMMPACVSGGHATDASFQRCYVTGWGQTLPERGTYAVRSSKFSAIVSKPDTYSTLYEHLRITSHHMAAVRLLC